MHSHAYSHPNPNKQRISFTLSEFTHQHAVPAAHFAQPVPVPVPVPLLAPHPQHPPPPPPLPPPPRHPPRPPEHVAEHPTHVPHPSSPPPPPHARSQPTLPHKRGPTLLFFFIAMFACLGCAMTILVIAIELPLLYDYTETFLRARRLHYHSNLPHPPRTHSRRHNPGGTRRLATSLVKANATSVS